MIIHLYDDEYRRTVHRCRKRSRRKLAQTCRDRPQGEYAAARSGQFVRRVGEGGARACHGGPVAPRGSPCRRRRHSSAGAGRPWVRPGMPASSAYHSVNTPASGASCRTAGTSAAAAWRSAAAKSPRALRACIRTRWPRISNVARPCRADRATSSAPISSRRGARPANASSAGSSRRRAISSAWRAAWGPRANGVPRPLRGDRGRQPGLGRLVPFGGKRAKGVFGGGDHVCGLFRVVAAAPDRRDVVGADHPGISSASPSSRPAPGRGGRPGGGCPPPGSAARAPGHAQPLGEQRAGPAQHVQRVGLTARAVRRLLAR